MGDGIDRRRRRGFRLKCGAGPLTRAEPPGSAVGPGTRPTLRCHCILRASIRGHRGPGIPTLASLPADALLFWGPNWRDLTLPRASPGYKRHSATALINCISCCIWLHLLHFIAFYSPFVLENRGLGVSPDRSVTRRPLIGIMTRCSVRCATCWRNSASQPKPSTSNFKFIPDSGTEHQRAASIC